MCFFRSKSSATTQNSTETYHKQFTPATVLLGSVFLLKYVTYNDLSNVYYNSEVGLRVKLLVEFGLRLQRWYGTRAFRRPGNYDMHADSQLLCVDA